ncbi:TMEM198 [Cordylochernes scorpioides]|uniref:Transmembrane protein 198 n=1 Tax=Cordylochernes scorpioides TaxID=51811 RepID=A0ABY6KBA9_9ARAC|nr:TMEM198 [Cordylochernes scorpioides]
MDEDAPECPNVVLGGYEVWSALVASLYLTFGIVFTLYGMRNFISSMEPFRAVRLVVAGYRCFKATLFLVGLSGGACLTWALCRLGGLPPGSAGEAAGALGAGALAGLAAMQAPRLGLALTGLHTGALASVAGILIAFPWVRPAAVWHVAALAAALGLTGALLAALVFHKGLTILGSALCGAAAVAGSCDYFMERLAMVHWVWAVVQLEPPAPEPCWLSWVLLGLWPGLSLLGTVVQWRLTGTGCHHSVSGFQNGWWRKFLLYYNTGIRVDTQYLGWTLSIAWAILLQQLPWYMELTNWLGGAGLPRRTMQVDLQRIRQEEHKAEQKQQKYRYLYQVRTAHGDVISQVIPYLSLMWSNQ